MERFEVKADFSPSGDQPSAISALARGLERGDRFQTLLGITGSGKSATVAWTIEQAQRPALIIAPNKALAAQLANEFRQFFPGNRVEYFVSYYDYYQPEAYMPQTDTYIEKDATINDEIDGLRHSATSGLMVRDDVIIIASVSCIYGLGSPEQYEGQLLRLVRGVEFPLSEALRRLVMLQYQRNEVSLARGRFRVKGDTLDIFPTYQETVMRVEYFGDEVDRIVSLNPVTGEKLEELTELYVFPATHYVTPEERMNQAIAGDPAGTGRATGSAGEEGKLLEAQRLRMRTNYDLEMMREIGYCSGIENYSRYLDGREAGEPPYTLLDYFPDDYITIIDESHITIPQIGGQFEADRSRKEVLVEHGFRLPSALDNRPLRFDEWLDRTGQVICMSATPGPFERQQITQAGGTADTTHRPGGPRGDRAPHQGDRSTTCWPRSASGRPPTSGCWSPPSPRRCPRTWPTTCWRWACGPGTCTRRSTPWRGCISCGNCAWAISTCWWGSTCCGRASTFRRCRWWPSSTPTRKASCVRRPR